MPFAAPQSAATLWLWTTLLGGGALAAFYFAFRSLLRARLIEDTPRALVRSAHQGYVELHGTAEYLEGQALQAPLSGAPCCWFRYRVEKRSGKHWRTVDSASSEQPFVLRDDTGDCLIDPRGAEVTGAQTRRWHSSTLPQRLQKRPSSWFGEIAEAVTEGLGGRYRLQEERIAQGSDLYTLGWFRTLDPGDHQQAGEAVARRLLREWKRDSAGLLARFDIDGDGAIDPREWEQARQAALREGRRTYRERASRRTPHRLEADGPARLPFLLSTRSQRSLVRRYRLYSAAGLGGFFLCAGLALHLFRQAYPG